MLVIQFKETDYNTKISETEKKLKLLQNTTPEFNKLTAEKIAARIAQAKLASKNDIFNFVNKADVEDKQKN